MPAAAEVGGAPGAAGTADGVTCRIGLLLVAALFMVGVWQQWASSHATVAVVRTGASNQPEHDGAVRVVQFHPRPATSDSLGAPAPLSHAGSSFPTPEELPPGFLVKSRWGPVTVRAVLRPEDWDGPYWGDEYDKERASGGDVSTVYPRYLLPIQPTAEDVAIEKRFSDFAGARGRRPEEVVRYIADGPDPLPGWLPSRARPIPCHGLDYFSGHFSIPRGNIVSDVPPKTQDWGTVIPGKMSTYVFKKEEEYRADLERSRFAITRRRYGWATNRNLEILAAGSVPYFCGVTTIPPTGTLASLPLHAIRAAVHIPGVSCLCFPHKKALGFPINNATFNATLYTAFARKLLGFTQRYQTTAHHALYVLSASSLRALPKKVLVVWASHYTIMLTGFVNGLRELGVHVTDVPRRTEIYAGEGCDEAKRKTYAKGWFFFCRTNESTDVNRTAIDSRIRDREFDLIVISVTDLLTYNLTDPFTQVPYYDTILRAYPRRKVIVLNDADLIRPMYDDVASKMMARDTLYFKRETHGCAENWRG